MDQDHKKSTRLIIAVDVHVHTYAHRLPSLAVRDEAAGRMTAASTRRQIDEMRIEKRGRVQFEGGNQN